jgi:hypothetical protein
MNSANNLNQAQQTIAQNYINLYIELNLLRKDNASEDVMEAKMEDMDDVMCQMCQDVADYVESVLGEGCFN